MTVRQVVLQLADEIESHIERLADLSVPSVRRQRREISESVRAWSAKSVILLAEALLERQNVIPRWVPYELINLHPDALESLTAPKLRQLGRGMSTWGEVDAFACYLSGPAWRESQVTDELIHGWAKSKNRWWRRAALVSTVPLNCTSRGGSGDARRTLAVCDLLLSDRDDMVVKAMSWALRELSTKDRNAVKRYLRQRDNSLHTRVKREVTNKITTGLKNPKTNS